MIGLCGINSLRQRFTLELSYHFPIRGSMSEVENMPAPPINERPSAPVFGKYSETNPTWLARRNKYPLQKQGSAEAHNH
jgi:hypothetical protein